MSEDKEPDAKAAPTPTLPGTLWALANLVFKREASLAIVSFAVLVGIGAAGAVYAQDKFDAGFAPIREEILTDRKANAELHAKQALEREQDRAQIATVKMQSAETMLNVRLLVESLKLKPIILVEPAGSDGRDAGR